MPALPPGWATLPFFTDDWPQVASRIAADSRRILPPEPLRFAALERTPPERVRAVILGQDPYPTPGHANGLAFSVAPGVKLPASLRNIFREMEADIGNRPESGDLTPWAEAGVLLLNTALTVPAHQAGGHAGLGWESLARQVLGALSDRPRAFVLWGKKAQALRSAIDGDGHLFVTSPHPSPYSAHSGFFGSRPFSRVNAWLEDRGELPIRWA